jgi:chromosome segregation ATPase
VANSSVMSGYARDAFVPTQFQEDIDVAGCALDEQLEQLQRHYAAASRAAARARIEIDDLERRDDIPEYLMDHARRQHAAAETRCTRLLSAIEALEDRLETE